MRPQSKLVKGLLAGVFVFGGVSTLVPSPVHAAEMTCEQGFTDTFTGSGAVSTTNWTTAGFTRLNDKVVGSEEVDGDNSYLYTKNSFNGNSSFELNGDIDFQEGSAGLSYATLIVGFTEVPGFTTNGAYFYAETNETTGNGLYVGLFNASGQVIKLKYYPNLTTAPKYRLSRLDGAIYGYFDLDGDGKDMEMFGAVKVSNGGLYGQIILSAGSTDASDTATVAEFEGDNAKAECNPDIVKFSKWTSDGSAAGAAVGTAVFNGRLYQARRTSGATAAFTYRSTNDGVWDGEADEAWKQPSIGGSSMSEVGLAVFQNKLYATTRSKTNAISTASMNADGTWNKWVAYGTAGTGVTMAAFNPGSGDRLYQAARQAGTTATQLYIRYTKDGVFDGTGEGEVWAKVPAKSPAEPGLANYNGRLYLTFKGNGGDIWTGSTADGAFNGSETREVFVASGGRTASPVGIMTHNGVLYQTMTGASNRVVYTRKTTNGVNWSAWSQVAVNATPYRVNGASFNGKLYQVALTTKPSVMNRNSI